MTRLVVLALALRTRAVQRRERLAIASELDRLERRYCRLDLHREASVVADLARWLRAAAGEVEPAERDRKAMARLLGGGA